MPIYEFRCRGCGEIFEELSKTKDVSPVCPACGKRETEKIISMSGAPKKGGFPFKIGPVHPMAKKWGSGGGSCGSCGGSGAPC